MPLAVIGMRTVILNEPERFADLIRIPCCNASSASLTT
jgi:hypothetical protein